MSFDLVPATSQYLTFPITAINVAEGSFCCWFAADFAPDGTTEYGFLDVDTLVARLSKTTTTNKVRWEVDGRYNTFTCTSAWTSGSWAHVACLYKKTGNILRVFINGTELVGGTAAGSWGADSPLTNITLGAYVTPSNYFDGDLAELAIYNRMLTYGEIQLLAKGWVPSVVGVDGLTLYAPLLHDALDDFGNHGTVLGGPAASVHPPKVQHFRRLMDCFVRSYDPAKKALRISNVGAPSATYATIEDRNFVFKAIHDPALHTIRTVT